MNMFCVDLRMNSELCPTQHSVIGSYNRDGKRLMNGMLCAFKKNRLHFFLTGLNTSQIIDCCSHEYLYDKMTVTSWTPIHNLTFWSQAFMLFIVHYLQVYDISILIHTHKCELAKMS